MEKFQTVLLAVWREACGNIEIGESTKKIATLLSEDMPVETVLVRRVDPEKRRLETVAIDGNDSDLPTTTECSATEIKTLIDWGENGTNTDNILILKLLVPTGIEGPVMVGPLTDRGKLSGVLILVAKTGRTFNTRHNELMGVLLNPFAVALSNDRQLREMASLREAAEADKRSLLTKLGRRNLGDQIVGETSGLKAVMERVELVAQSNAPVLIFGQTGTGKELIARAIHTRSSRHDGPINRVNCGAIPPELVDSQLFGHEKGAFTGAVETRKGWFERADGGTLFLDEIGELPLAAQVRLLRILQDGWLERVGGEQSIKVDVRIVAATHCDLAGMVAEGTFREDLWYRLAVFPILLPTLGERKPDIAELAAHFAEKAANKFGLAPIMPTNEDIERLIDYDWPGNVRELGAVIDRAAILGNSKRLEIAKALGVSDHFKNTVKTKKRLPTREEERGFTSLDEAMKNHIETALAISLGRIEGDSGAANLLKINPHTLRARMRKLGIEWKTFRN